MAPPCCLERLSGKCSDLVSNSGKTEHTYDERYKHTMQAVYKNQQEKSTRITGHWKNQHKRFKGY